eukprot:m.240098 g.240098  ORF g.240098 m.240098 type:complete len:295 (-) comp17128_c1_seq1:730-1614(-)
MITSYLRKQRRDSSSLSISISSCRLSFLPSVCLLLLLLPYRSSAVPLQQQPADEQQSSLSPFSISTMMAGACLPIAVVVIAVLLALLCAGKKQKADRELAAFQHTNSVITMERNPTYSGSDLTRENLKPAARSNEEDEDELANVRMEAQQLRAHRAQSVSLKHVSLKRSRAFIHHNTRRPDAEAMLREHVAQTGESGVFLIRAKREDEGLYALDVAWKDEVSNSVYVTHHLLNRSQTGVYMVDEQVFDRLMSIEDVITYLSKPRNRALPGTLSTFIPANELEATLQPQHVQSSA